MAQLSTPWPIRSPEPRPWPRASRRRWVRPDDTVGMERLFAALPSLPRAELSRLTTWMIDRMDEIDGDADVELNGDETDHRNGEDDFIGHGDGKGLPGDSDDAEDGHDREQEEAHE